MTNRNLPLIFDYLDFRKYLGDYYTRRKEAEPGFTHEYACHRLGQRNSKSYFANVVKGVKPVTAEFINRFIELLELPVDEERYFRALVSFNQAFNQKEKEFHFDQLVKQSSSQKRLIGKNEYVFYSDWYHSVIRALLDVFDFKGDYAALAKMLMPSVPLKQIKKSIHLLLSLGLIKKDEKGCFRPTEKTVKTDEHVHDELILQYQMHCLEMAKANVLHKHGMPQDISTNILSVSEDGLKLRSALSAAVERCVGVRISSETLVYANNPSVNVTLASGPNAISNVKIGVIIPGLMKLPSEMRLDGLAAGQSRTVALDVAFDGSEVLKSASTRTEYGQATVSFTENNAEVERKLTVPVKTYEKNAIDWSIPESFAGFVTYRHPVVNDLARKALRVSPPSSGTDRDLRNTLAVFSALQALGIMYVKDPTSSPGAALLDRVQFPHETIRTRSGDCDDLSALYAALLSAIGIRAAAILYTDHVLVMFNTGIYEKNCRALSPDTTLTVAYDGTLWIPVETTMLAKGFVSAWQSAAREYHQALAEGEGVHIIDLESAWKTYPPAPVEGVLADLDLGKLPAIVTTETSQLDKSAQSLIAGELSKLQSRIAALDPKDTSAAALLNRTGVLLVRQQKYVEAAQTFEKALKRRNDVAIRSNQACAVLLSGDEAKALQLFEPIYKQDPNGRIAVNRALCLYVNANGDEGISKFVAALQKAAAMMPSASKLSDYSASVCAHDRDESTILGFMWKEDDDSRLHLDLLRLRSAQAARRPTGSTREEDAGGYGCGVNPVSVRDFFLASWTQGRGFNPTHAETTQPQIFFCASSGAGCGTIDGR